MFHSGDFTLCYQQGTSTFFSISLIYVNIINQSPTRFLIFSTLRIFSPNWRETQSHKNINYSYFLKLVIYIVTVIKSTNNSWRQMWKPSFTTAQLEFFASIKTKVSILPYFSDTEMSLMTTKVGPFKANQPTNAPLWFALELKACQRCKIYTPFWFDKTELNEFIDKERKYPNELTNLQNQEFFQISYIFISQAADDIENLTEMRGLIEGLENMRRQKVRRMFEESKGAIKLLNLTTYEVNRLRQPLSRLSMMVDRLKKVEKQK